MGTSCTAPERTKAVRRTELVLPDIICRPRTNPVASAGTMVGNLVSAPVSRRSAPWSVIPGRTLSTVQVTVLSAATSSVRLGRILPTVPRTAAFPENVSEHVAVELGHPDAKQD